MKKDILTAMTEKKNNYRKEQINEGKAIELSQMNLKAYISYFPNRPCSLLFEITQDAESPYSFALTRENTIYLLKYLIKELIK